MDASLSIPGYRVERELGKGGMARVYLAFDEKLERPVALKVLLRSLTEEESVTQRFVREAKTAAKLRHSNIVSIYDVGRLGDLYYFSMEYLGESLRDRIRQAPVPPPDAMQILIQLADALDYAHGEGLTHRDVKPENIMFRRDGIAVLADFGIAKAVGSQTKLTATGISIGTPHYMSPEQARGLELDGRSDFYSLGVVLYEMLTGRVPYDAKETVAIAIMHIQEPVPLLPPGLSGYQALISGLMAKDRERRLRNGKSVIEEIQRLALRDKLGSLLNDGLQARLSPQGLSIALGPSVEVSSDKSRNVSIRPAATAQVVQPASRPPQPPQAPARKGYASSPSRSKNAFDANISKYEAKVKKRAAIRVRAYAILGPIALFFMIGLNFPGIVIAFLLICLVALLRNAVEQSR